MTGFVYFLINAAMPDLVKIGHTTNAVEERIRQLNATGVPTQFELIACVMVEDPSRVERALHDQLRDKRYVNNREFFVGSAKDILSLAMPTLLGEVVGASGGSSMRRTELRDIVDERTSQLLKTLAFSHRQACHLFELFDDREDRELDIVRRLATLRQMGFVAEKLDRDPYRPSLWKITSDGVKYCFDSDILTTEGI